MNTHTLTISNAYIIGQVEARTFKVGKAVDTGANDKLVSDVRLTDLQYDREMAWAWIDDAVGNIESRFCKYHSGTESEGTGDAKTADVYFTMPQSWPDTNGDAFDASCIEYVVNSVIYDFLRLSLPKVADLYALKADASMIKAERKLLYKHI